MPKVPKKKKVEPDDPEQFARFVEVAESVKAENADELFEEAFEKIARAKPKLRPERSNSNKQV